MCETLLAICRSTFAAVTCRWLRVERPGGPARQPLVTGHRARPPATGECRSARRQRGASRASGAERLSTSSIRLEGPYLLLDRRPRLVWAAWPELVWAAWPQLVWAAWAAARPE